MRASVKNSFLEFEKETRVSAFERKSEELFKVCAVILKVSCVTGLYLC